MQRKFVERSHIPPKNINVIKIHYARGDLSLILLHVEVKAPIGSLHTKVGWLSREGSLPYEESPPPGWLGPTLEGI